MRRPPVTPNTLYALEATEHANQRGLFYPFHLGLYKAYWEHGKDIGSLEVIRDVAVECGLDWPELEERLESSFYQDTVMSQFREAMELGIQGIPAFLIGEYLFTGARPYDTFKTVMEKVLAQREAS